MDKKFTEYSHFDLSAINKEVLKKWDDEQVFHKSLEIRAGARPTVCRVYITSWPVPSKIFFADIKQ